MSKILQPKQLKDRMIGGEVIETTGEVFSDGVVLELIRFESGAGEGSLSKWDGNNTTIGQEFEIRGSLYRAPRLNSAFLRAIRLPRQIAPYV